MYDGNKIYHTHTYAMCRRLQTLALKKSLSKIAKTVKRNKSTISREVKPFFSGQRLQQKYCHTINHWNFRQCFFAGQGAGQNTLCPLHSPWFGAYETTLLTHWCATNAGKRKVFSDKLISDLDNNLLNRKK